MKEDDRGSSLVEWNYRAPRVQYRGVSFHVLNDKKRFLFFLALNGIFLYFFLASFFFLAFSRRESIPFFLKSAPNAKLSPQRQQQFSSTWETHGTN